MFQELENKVVVITGAGSGIGKSFAENFGKAKAKVVLNYRSDRHLDEWQKVIDINLTGAFIGSREAINQFLKEDKKGVIINTSSVHDTIPWPNYVNYAASKGGMKLMMETMSMEYAQYGIRINNISPGAIVTEHTKEKFSDPKTREETLEMIPAREIGEAQDVANVALFLASDLASYIHGTTLYVDGGMTNYPAFMGGKG
ncbi:SDR family oxidoreductase [Staphylococcus caprae]|uniref:SDR family oxidoreductase n=1 Tax=Staphylococcus caprae TaxID=29380 RepID=UPI003B224E9F